jgi:hypothetical protein
MTLILLRLTRPDGAPLSVLRYQAIGIGFQDHSIAYSVCAKLPEVKALSPR